MCFWGMCIVGGCSGFVMVGHRPSEEYGPSSMAMGDSTFVMELVTIAIGLATIITITNIIIIIMIYL